CASQKLDVLLWSLLQTCGEENISSPVLREVKFHSVDYRNILHWKTQSHPDGNQKYFVQYKIYGEKHWTTARHCQGITQLYCDLSQQTSDPWERYYARVQAEVSGHQSSWVLSPRFNPHWETSVSPPTMRLNVTERAIVVRLKPPKSPYRRRRGSWISMKKLQKLTYRVYLMHSGSIQASATSSRLCDHVSKTGKCISSVYLLRV
uniref:Interleukin 22 receptor subunit alpha 2 n=1 Tax=Paramormyrops kingsleyae TaxID=1676925 RepID=A0A3B3QYG7_9TELE